MPATARHSSYRAGHTTVRTQFPAAASYSAAPIDEITLDGETVTPQPGGFYGGWVTSDVVGPFKGGPGSSWW